MKPEDKVTTDRLTAAGTTQTPLTDAICPLGLWRDNTVPHYVIELAGHARSLELALTASRAREAELVKALEVAKRNATPPADERCEQDVPSAGLRAKPDETSGATPSNKERAEAVALLVFPLAIYTGDEFKHYRAIIKQQVEAELAAVRKSAGAEADLDALALELARSFYGYYSGDSAGSRSALVYFDETGRHLPGPKSTIERAKSILSRHHTAAKSTPGVDAWQPIESAPKTRKAIQVYCAENLCQYMAYWDGDCGVWRTFGGYTVITVPLTHWKPVGPKPADADGASGGRG